MCGECDRLRAEVRELREEIAEWERMGATERDNGAAEVIAAAFCMHPQESRLVKALMDSRNAVVSHHDLSERIGYAGSDKWYKDKRGLDVSARKDQLKVAAHRARKWLEQAGVFEAIVSVRSVGYMMTRQKAAEIEAVLDRE